MTPVYVSTDVCLIRRAVEMVPSARSSNEGTPVEASLANEAIRAEPTEAIIFLLKLASQSSVNIPSFAPITLSLTN